MCLLLLPDTSHVNWLRVCQAARKHIQSFLASGEIKTFYVWREMYLLSHLFDLHLLLLTDSTHTSPLLILKYVLDIEAL